MTESERQASEIGRNNIIWVERTNEWMRTKEVTTVLSGVEDTRTGEKREQKQVFIRLTDGHELVFGGEEIVRVKD